MSQTDVLMRSGNQTRDIGYGETPEVVRFNHSDIRIERSEWIRSSAGVGGRYRSQKRRFAGIGKANQADISDDFQFQIQDSAFPFLSRLELLWCPVDGIDVMQIPFSAASAMGRYEFLSVLLEIAEEFTAVMIEDQGSYRYSYFAIGGIGAVFLPAAAIAAALCFPLRFEFQINQALFSAGSL